MQKMLRSTSIIVALFVVFSSGYAQNKFDGYSLVVEADISGACPVKYQPSAGNGNSVDVYIAGTEQRTPATGLTACDGATKSGANSFNINHTTGAWCFEGPEPFYDVKLRNGTVYLWYPTTKDTGFFNVKDYRPVVRSAGANPQYTFSDPADWTNTIRNAIAVIAVRQGGTLIFPDGDYIVGTLDGNRRDPSYQAITLPSGIVLQGSGANASIPTTNLPSRRGSTRLRLRHENQTIFRIGGCTNHVTVQNLELLGNSALFGEMPRQNRGNYGIEGLGKWIMKGQMGQQEPNTSQSIKIENVTFQNLDKGIYVHNANDERCNTAEQHCGGWQFDYVLVDQGMFINNGTGIWVDTYNTDWKISNSFFSYSKQNPPGDGIYLQKAGIVLVEQTFGGGYNYGAHIGGTFLTMVTGTSLTVVSSGSERSERSIFTSPVGSITSMMVNVIGSVFGDKIDLNGRFNYNSTGNFYLAKTIDAEPSVTINSVGDRYCYDSQVLPGRCTDEQGRNVANPGPFGGRRMFETGRFGEDTGPNKIEGRPNYFGYNVEIGNGLMQFDPNITFRDITAWAAGQGVRPRVQDGAFLYCKDCRKNSSGICTQGGSGDGAFAKRVASQWRCD